VVSFLFGIMTKHFLYILYSLIKDRYYVGSTSDELESRIRKHNSNHAGFTGSVNDWELVHSEQFDDKVSAIKREKQIKMWKCIVYFTTFLTASITVPSTHLIMAITSSDKFGFFGTPQIRSASAFNS
jgi:putative endonuclease